MKCSNLLLTSLFFIFINFSTAQEKNVYEDINSQLWSNFTKAFTTSDYNLFRSLHTNEMIRVNGDQNSIRQMEDYIKRYKRHWQNKTVNETITFRFIERINHDDIASERGIYKYTKNPNTKDEKSSYGKFHVILKKEESWKILMDYDSSENKSINEDSFLNAYAIDDFEKF